jgi:hypothetical protein
MNIRFCDLDLVVANEIEDNFTVTNRFDGSVDPACVDIEVIGDIETYGSSIKLIDHDTETDYVIDFRDYSTITIY